MHAMYYLSTEKPDDWWEVEYLLDTAFGPGRTGLSSYQLRADVDPVAELCLVAHDDIGVIAGTIRFWPIQIGAEVGLLLGPVAVHPTRQGEGLGAQLMAEALEKARKSGWRWVVLVGDEPYYSRFGFSRAVATDIAFPPPTNPERVLAQELVDGALANVAGIVGKPVADS